MAIEFVDPQEAKKVSRVIVKATVEDGNVVIKASYEDGTKVACGNLFCITSEGKFFRLGSVDPDLGFDLDEYGRIKEEED